MNPSDFSSRFVQLPDGRPGLRTCMQVETREPSKNEVGTTSTSSPSSEQPCLDFISSDESLDRYDEIISASGWKLANYQRNPVFQNAHQYGDVIFTLGRALITEVRVGTTSTSSPYLFQRIQFACDINPMARIAYGLYKGKFLNAVSVGFLPIRWETPNQNPERMKDNSPGQTRNECRPGYDVINENSLSPSDGERVGVRGPGTAKFRRRFLEQELLEVSAVGIPANPNALALGLKSGAVQKSDLKDTLDLFRSTLASPKSDEAGPRLHDRLLESLRTFQKILKS